MEIKPGYVWIYKPKLAHTVTAKDLNDGEVKNKVTVTITPPGGNEVPPQETENITPSEQKPVIKIEKKTSKVTDSNGKPYEDGKFHKEGDRIYYTFRVVNEGNVTINYFTFSDNKLEIKDREFYETIEKGKDFTFAPEEYYTVTPKDLDNAEVENEAKVKGKTPGGDTPEVPSNKNITPGEPDNSFKVEKETYKVTDAQGKELENKAYSAEGDLIYYSFKVTNTGNQTIKSVRIVDPLIGLDRTVEVNIKPGYSWTYKPNLPHTVSDRDIAEGEVKNKVVVTIIPPSGNEVPPQETENITPKKETPPTEPTTTSTETQVTTGATTTATASVTGNTTTTTGTTVGVTTVATTVPATTTAPTTTDVVSTTTVAPPMPTEPTEAESTTSVGTTVAPTTNVPTTSVNTTRSRNTETLPSREVQPIRTKGSTTKGQALARTGESNDYRAVVSLLLMACLAAVATRSYKKKHNKFD